MGLIVYLVGKGQSDLGIYYYGARWYDPYLNRMLQPDSIIPDPYNPLDWDRYSYSSNNPINYIDPTGHFAIPFTCPDWYCNNTWLSFSGSDPRLEGMAEVFGAVGCPLLGCHLNSYNNTIIGPTTQEYGEAYITNIPGPAMLAGPAKKGAEYFGRIIQTNNVDEFADLLAERIGGVSRARFESVMREFDVISDEFIGQAKPALRQIDKGFRVQAKQTFEAAVDTGRKVYYQFEGQPAKEVIDKLWEYSERYGVELIIDIMPLKPR